MFLMSIGMLSPANYLNDASIHIFNEVAGILWVIQICLSQGPVNMTGIFSVNWTIFYLVLSLVLNVILSASIAIRIMIYRRQGLEPSSRLYLVLALLVGGSCILYSTFSLLFLVPSTMKKPMAGIFLPVLIQVQVSVSALVLCLGNVVFQGHSFDVISVPNQH
jgi:hypothetical protein